MLRQSNIQLFEHLQKSNSQKRATEALFLDIAGSDGNMTIKDDEFSQLCLEDSVNSLYGLSSAKVCWVVAKKDSMLLRSEGNNYTLPLNSDDHVAVDAVIKDIDLFRVYKGKGEVLVLLSQKGKTPISFVVYGVPEEMKKKKPKKVKKAPKGNNKKRPTPTKPPSNKSPKQPPSIPPLPKSGD